MHTDTLIFDGIIYFLSWPSPPSLVPEHDSAVTYRCCLLSIHAERLIRNQIESSFIIHTSAHEWRRHSLLGTNKDSREKKYKHLRCHNVNNLWHLMWVNVRTSNSSSVSDTQLQPDPDFMFCFCRYCSSNTAIQNKCFQFTFMLKLKISSC